MYDFFSLTSPHVWMELTDTKIMIIMIITKQVNPLVSFLHVLDSCITTHLCGIRHTCWFSSIRPRAPSSTWQWWCSSSTGQWWCSSSIRPRAPSSTWQWWCSSSTGQWWCSPRRSCRTDSDTFAGCRYRFRNHLWWWWYKICIKKWAKWIVRFLQFSLQDRVNITYRDWWKLQVAFEPIFNINLVWSRYVFQKDHSYLPSDCDNTTKK